MRALSPPTPTTPPSWLARARFAVYGAVIVAGSLIFALHSEGWSATPQTFRIGSASMAPSLLPGWFTWVDLESYRERSPSRGDVVVFELRPPDRDRRFYVKRIVGLPGDWIEIRRGRLWINGSRVSHLPTERHFADDSGTINRIVTEVLGESTYEVLSTPVSEPRSPIALRVPEGHVFVLGDYRSHSQDSRSFGPIDQSTILGRVVRSAEPEPPRST